MVVNDVMDPIAFEQTVFRLKRFLWQKYRINLTRLEQESSSIGNGWLSAAQLSAADTTRMLRHIGGGAPEDALVYFRMRVFSLLSWQLIYTTTIALQQFKLLLDARNWSIKLNNAAIEGCAVKLKATRHELQVGDQQQASMWLQQGLLPLFELCQRCLKLKPELMRRQVKDCILSSLVPDSINALSESELRSLQASASSWLRPWQNRLGQAASAPIVSQPSAATDGPKSNLIVNRFGCCFYYQVAPQEACQNCPRQKN